MEPNNSPHRSGHGSLQHPYPHRAASSPHLLSHSPSRPLPPHFGAGSRPSSRASSPPPHSSSPASFMSQQGSIVTGGIFAQGESALGNDLATYLQRNFEPNPAPAAPRSPVHISCCCGDSDCENMQLFTTTVRGLEDEVRLAGGESINV
ncbi:hypothetical protein BC936DRAFT_143418 [Jimgerdemannia flammicorona]|uniref:Uncharacterized protein n=1 Tax=Jimgerdemannia flammicorona TaxID=994334 RepID=A0A432ZZ88_9FUNG|nr:hypothetical protein BC936DRAFT_143418 [Jimgerdemannia flammicorona]